MQVYIQFLKIFPRFFRLVSLPFSKYFSTKQQRNLAECVFFHRRVNFAANNPMLFQAQITQLSSDARLETFYDESLGASFLT